jgi:hypothetical protein
MPQLPEKNPKTSRPADAIGELICLLEDRDAAARLRAAAEIFARGKERALRAAEPWLGDEEIAACFVRGGAELRVTVGIAVEPEAFERIRSANGMPRLADVPADIDAREFELRFGGGVRLDVLTTRGESAGGAIERFLRKFGAGIQQVELEVTNVDRATGLLRARFGLAPLYARARSGADGTRVNFFLVAWGERGAEEKVLIELVEAAGE